MSRIAARFYSTSVAKKDLALGNFVNRNPRNRKKLGIDYKSAGYHLESPGRFYSTSVANKELVLENFIYCNPRNVEKLGIGYKPAGYHLENPGCCYWHTLKLHATGKYVTASIVTTRTDMYINCILASVLNTPFSNTSTNQHHSFHGAPTSLWPDFTNEPHHKFDFNCSDWMKNFQKHLEDICFEQPPQNYSCFL